MLFTTAWGQSEPRSTRLGSASPSVGASGHLGRLLQRQMPRMSALELWSLWSLGLGRFQGRRFKVSMPRNPGREVTDSGENPLPSRFLLIPHCLVD